jgi:sulfur-carrier protein adenylyltransferase/sulfurtransferase
MWWVTQPSRASSERQGIAELQSKFEWFKELKFRLTENFSFEVDFSLDLKGSIVTLTLIYPEVFPNLPPKVIPKEEVRLSSHQYGAGGELCLEYRTDNWTTEITGAMMIESAYKLLGNENDITALPVPSAHRLLVGQDVRNSVFRFLFAHSLNEHLEHISIDAPLSAIVSEHLHAGTWVSAVSRLGTEESPIYEVKMPLSESATNYEALVIRVANGVLGESTLEYEGLVKLVGVSNVEKLLATKPDQFWSPILLYDGKIAKLLVVWENEGKRSTIEFHTVRLPTEVNRLEWNIEDISRKMVAVVGCGSIGSKIAVSLARSGVRNFLLIDTDLFLKHNLVRNELDRTAIGLNKTKALKARLIEIAEGCNVELRDLNLGGQESASWTIAAMKALSKADIIVDATANSTAFNMCATAAAQYSIPLIWGVVYSGGIGGLVARARPHTDPTPILARKQILDWYEAQGVPWERTGSEGYETDQDQEIPQIAGDAEVSIVASHMTRFVLDILLARQPSLFPHSVYVIGFKQSWIFSAPMEAWPISLRQEGNWGPDVEPNAGTQLTVFIEEVTGIKLANAS